MLKEYLGEAKQNSEINEKIHMNVLYKIRQQNCILVVKYLFKIDSVRNQFVLYFSTSVSQTRSRLEQFVFVKQS